jgi:sortase A
VFGELFITGGVLVFLFLGWQLYLNDLVVGDEQNNQAVALGQKLGSDVPVNPAAATTDYGVPAVGVEPVAETTKFANIYIPRFGADYVRTISQGVSASNVLKTGVGHYPGTQMPGEVGNFAIAAHRTTHGAPFHEIMTLQPGDKIYVQSELGWYTYIFRTIQYVKPTTIGVLEPVPQQPGIAATDRIMTMTSCNPLLSAAERIVAYSVFDSWQPTSAGPPAAIAVLAQGGV